MNNFCSYFFNLNEKKNLFPPFLNFFLAVYNKEKRNLPDLFFFVFAMPHFHGGRSYGHQGHAHGGYGGPGRWQRGYGRGLNGYYAVGNGARYYAQPVVVGAWPQYDALNGWGSVTPNQVYYQNWTDPYNWQLQRINNCLECGANLNNVPICVNCT